MHALWTHCNVSTGHLLGVFFYLESDGLAISGETFDVPNQQTHLIIRYLMWFFQHFP